MGVGNQVHAVFRRGAYGMTIVAEVFFNSFGNRRLLVCDSVVGIDRIQAVLKISTVLEYFGGVPVQRCTVFERRLGVAAGGLTA